MNTHKSFKELLIRFIRKNKLEKKLYYVNKITKQNHLKKTFKNISFSEIYKNGLFNNDEMKKFCLFLNRQECFFDKAIENLCFLIFLYGLKMDFEKIFFNNRKLSAKHFKYKMSRLLETIAPEDYSAFLLGVISSYKKPLKIIKPNKRKMYLCLKHFNSFFGYRVLGNIRYY